MFDINTLKFDEKGLIPAIVVDADTEKVLTLAYMNRESLQISMEKGLTCFYSRSITAFTGNNLHFIINFSNQ